MPTKTSAIVLAVAIALLAPSMALGAKQYALKHPKHEHCRTHYVRKVEQVKVHGRKVKETVCVYHAPQPAVSLPPEPPAPPAPTPLPAPTVPTSTPPTPTPAPTLTTTFTIVTLSPDLGGFGTGQPRYNTVSVSVGTLTGGVIGVPVTVTLVNQATRAVLGSFAATSYGGTCAIVNELAGGNWVLKGEAVAGDAGCPISPVSAPAEQGVGIDGSFAGNAQDASSTSEEQLVV